MKHSAPEIAPRPAGHRPAGFTLIELMITIVVIAILAAIAIPIYQHQVREARRTSARTALLELAGREERYYATNNAYTSNAADLGYGTVANPLAWPIKVGDGFYEIDQPMIPANTVPAPSYSLTAVPVPGTDQAKDSDCTSFTVDSTGNKTATGAVADPTSTCWGP